MTTESKRGFRAFTFTFDGLYIHNTRSRDGFPDYMKDSVFVSIAAKNFREFGDGDSHGPVSLGAWSSNKPVPLKDFTVSVPTTPDFLNADVKFSISIWNAGHSDLQQRIGDVAEGLLSCGADDLAPGAGELVDFVYRQYLQNYFFQNCDGPVLLNVFHYTVGQLFEISDNSPISVRDQGAAYNSPCQQSDYEYRFRIWKVGEPHH